MAYEGNDRYQFQPFSIKAARWLRHMPLAFLSGVCHFLLAIRHLAGMAKSAEETASRWEMQWQWPRGSISRLGLFWSYWTLHYTLHISRAHFAMGAHRSASEFFAELKEE